MSRPKPKVLLEYVDKKTYKVEQVLSIVDRQENDEADDLFEKENIEFVSLFTLDDLSY